jgi:hypothetical protein
VSCVRQAVAVTLWLIVVVAVSALVGAGETSGRATNHAGLIVWFEDGSVESRQVEFSEDSISGVELLRRSGLGVVFAGFGGLGSGVCKIGDTGCADPSDCFCQCRSADCRFWEYFTLNEGSWMFQNAGASTRRLRHGDVDAWVWGSGRQPPSGLSDHIPEDPVVEPTDPPPAPTSRPSSSGNVVPGSGGSQAPPADGSGPAAPATGVLGQQGADAPETPEGQSAPPSVTPPLTMQVRGAVETPPEDGGSGEIRSTEGNDGGGPPVGLLAFAVTAGVVAVTTVALMIRRRVHR